MINSVFLFPFLCIHGFTAPVLWVVAPKEAEAKTVLHIDRHVVVHVQLFIVDSFDGTLADDSTCGCMRVEFHGWETCERFEILT